MLIGRTTIPIRPWAEKLIPLFLLLIAFWGIGDGFASLKDMKFGALLEAWPIILLLLLGSVLNWGLEAQKWTQLARKGTGLTYGESVKGVLAGVTIGMWMPGRIGAWLGKLHFVPNGKRTEALVPLMGSSASQFVLTVLMAAVAGSFWWWNGSSVLPALSPERLMALGGLFTLTFLLGGVLLYRSLHSPLGKRLLDRLGFQPDKLLSLQDLSAEQYSKVLGLAGLRYLVFLAQFVLALTYWTQGVAIASFFMAVPVTLFIVSVLPSFVLSKLGVREMVVVAVMGPMCGDEAGLLLASLSIWVVNLLLPAMVGAFCLIRSRVLSSRRSYG
jgi:hypothetical protein